MVFFRRMIPVFLLCLILPLPGAAQTVLDVGYFNRPPYYHTEQGQARGFFSDLVRQVLEHSGVEYRFVEMPSNRLLREVMRREDPFSTIGWFRTPERDALFRFSLPLYRDKPLVLLSLKTLQPFMAAYSTLEEVLADPSLTIGVISFFSYGPEVDAALAASRAPREVVAGEQVNLVKMLAAGRISYLLAAPEEIPVLIRTAGLEESDFFTVTLDDVPLGNRRYILYGAGVDSEWIDRIDRAILEVCGEIE
jgi:polar amino acid transport system substrate-binding protein